MSKFRGKSGMSLGALVLGFFLLANGQVSADPLVQFPTGDAAWTVDLTYRDPKDPSKPADPAVTGLQIKKIDATQVGDYRRSVYTWSNGGITESWKLIKANVYAVENIHNGSIYVIPMYDNHNAEEMVVNIDEATFDWVDADYFKDASNYNGKPSLHYQGMISPGSSVVTENEQSVLIPKAKVLYQAWIDKKTLLPLAFDDSSRLAVITFQAPPTAPLVPPQRFEDRIKRYFLAVTLPKPLQPPSK